MRVKQDLFIIYWDGPKLIKENIKKQLNCMKNQLKSTKELFLRMILIWVIPTTAPVMCITTWASIRKHFRLTKKHLKFDNNHFLRIILIWLLPTTTSVMCIATWASIRKHFHVTKKHLKFDNN